MIPLAANLDITAADWTNPLRARAALFDKLRAAETEVERMQCGIVHLLVYAGRRDGKVPAPMLRRLLIWEERP